MAFTEIKPKNTLYAYRKEDYIIPNFDLFTNNNSKRGVAIYVDKALNACECEELNESDFQESVWCTFENFEDGKVLLRCIYRSPNNSTQENDEKLFQLLKSKYVTRFNKVVIMGDFNYPNVKWNGIWSGLKNNEILQKIHDAFLIQKVCNPTRRRLNQTPTMDDWILVSEDNLISNITHLDPLGKSDHDVLIFQLNVSLNKVKQRKKYTYNLRKGDYIQLRNIIENHDWSVLSVMNVDESWCHLKKILQNGMDESESNVYLK